MRLLTFAAGFATGYVLGSRAGREAYEQIVARFDQVRSNPTVVQAQEKAKDAIRTGADAAGSTSPAAAIDESPGRPTTTPTPRPSRRSAATPDPAIDGLP